MFEGETLPLYSQMAVKALYKFYNLADWRKMHSFGLEGTSCNIPPVFSYIGLSVQTRLYSRGVQTPAPDLNAALGKTSLSARGKAL